MSDPMTTETAVMFMEQRDAALAVIEAEGMERAALEYEIEGLRQAAQAVVDDGIVWGDDEVRMSLVVVVRLREVLDRSAREDKARRAM